MSKGITWEEYLQMPAQIVAVILAMADWEAEQVLQKRKQTEIEAQGKGRGRGRAQGQGQGKKKTHNPNKGRR
jgi:hypothetical protein